MHGPLKHHRDTIPDWFAVSEAAGMELHGSATIAVNAASAPMAIALVVREDAEGVSVAEEVPGTLRTAVRNSATVAAG
jgi:hypothetical protein